MTEPIPGIGGTLTELGEVISRATRELIHTSLPATVILWIPPAGAPPERKPALVDVQIDLLYRREINTAADIEGLEVPLERATGWQAQGPYPILKSCPVLYSGPDGMRSSGPIMVGASGWVHFVERSIDGWIQTGGPIDPAFDYQWHHLSDAFFVPGNRYGTIAEDIDPTRSRVGSADGCAGMEITEGPADTRELTLSTDGPKLTIDAATLIHLGAAATLGVARLTDTVDASAAMTQFMADVVAALVTIAAAVPVVITPPIPPTEIGLISGASTKVLAED